jgi:endonuclease III
MAASPSSDALVAELLQRFGRTYAQEAGIRLADQPAPLYQLLVLATLISARISADIAVAAARELFAAGYRTPRAMTEASWQDRVDALGRGHYKRYDERTATMLGDGAELLTERWHGDLRRLRDEADGAVGVVAGRLEEFPGIGPAGASVFLREAQAVAVGGPVRGRARANGRPRTRPAHRPGRAGPAGWIGPGPGPAGRGAGPGHADKECCRSGTAGCSGSRLSSARAGMARMASAGIRVASPNAPP